MADFSIIQKIKLFFETVVSIPFFLFYSFSGIFLLIIMIINIRKKRKLNRILYFLSLLFFLSFVVIKYFDVIVNVFDTFIGNVVKAVYFPSFGLYITLLIISNILFVFSFFSKTFKNLHKIISGVVNILLDFIFLIIINLISSNNIHLSIELELYENSSILSFLQTSMILFIFLGNFYLFAVIQLKLKKFDKNIIFDDANMPKMGIYNKADTHVAVFNKDEIKLVGNIGGHNEGNV